MKKLLLAAAGAALTAAPVAAAPPTLTLTAAPTVVAYGGSTVLSGKLSSGKSGQAITLEGQECGQSAFKKTASATTVAGGNFSAPVTPTLATTYQAKQKSATSPTVAIKVTPLLTLKRTGGTSVRKFTVTLTSAQSFVGKQVLFQKWASRKWRTVKTVTLKTVVTSKAPTQLTSAKFSVRIARGLKVRAALPASQAGACYLGTASVAVRS